MLNRGYGITKAPLRSLLLVNRGFTLKRLVSDAATARSEANSNPNSNSNSQSKSKFKSHWKIYLATFLAGSLTAKYVPIVSLLEYYLNSDIPGEGDAEGLIKYTQQLESKLQGLKIVKQLSANPDFNEHRDWNYIHEPKILSEAKKDDADEERPKVQKGTGDEQEAAETQKAADSVAINTGYNPASITEDALAVPGGFSIRPLIFNNPKTDETVSIVYVGSKLCGYPYLVHGGILATILDELCKKSVGFKVNRKGGSVLGDTHLLSTARLDLSYRFPTVANNFIVVKSHVGESAAVDKKEYGVTGNIEDLNGKLLVKGSANVLVRDAERVPDFEGGNRVKKGLKRWPF